MNRLHQIIVTCLGVVLTITSGVAQAGGRWIAPSQQPDNFSNWQEHLFLVGFIPGIVVGQVWPEMSPLKQFATCSIPGLIHELDPSSGNTRSNRDLLVNSIGCGLGQWANSGFSIGVGGPQGKVQVMYSVKLP